MQTQNSIAQKSFLSGEAVGEISGMGRGAILADTGRDTAAMLAEHASMVKIIVSKMRCKLPAHADSEELECAGMTGLLAAIERFDQSKGYSFQTYASVRIRGAILDELRAMDMVPRSVRLKQRSLERVSSALEQRMGRVPTEEELRKELKLDVRAFAKLRMQTRPVSIVSLDGDLEGSDTSFHECIADDSAEIVPERIEREEMQELVARKIMELPEQARKVLALYYNEGMRLAEIGELMGLSEARICQVRAQAIEHLRRFVNRMSEQGL
ncbi:MAG: FliA/WhiG family RNA polymerase sigma factor [Opitutales bacterium]|jgi:RNA polymerase sigma factor for flagellar operon FliA